MNHCYQFRSAESGAVGQSPPGHGCVVTPSVGIISIHCPLRLVSKFVYDVHFSGIACIAHTNRYWGNRETNKDLITELGEWEWFRRIDCTCSRCIRIPSACRRTIKSQNPQNGCAKMMEGFFGHTLEGTHNMLWVVLADGGGDGSGMGGGCASDDGIS